jgi:hypothetical protein
MAQKPSKAEPTGLMAIGATTVVMVHRELMTRTLQVGLGINAADGTLTVLIDQHLDELLVGDPVLVHPMYR